MISLGGKLRLEKTGENSTDMNFGKRVYSPSLETDYTKKLELQHSGCFVFPIKVAYRQKDSQPLLILPLIFNELLRSRQHQNHKQHCADDRRWQEHGEPSKTDYICDAYRVTPEH